MDKVAELIKAGKVKEITDMRDETDLNGLKLTIDLKRGTDPDKLMQKLFRMTADAPCAAVVDPATGAWKRTITGRAMNSCAAACPVGSKVYFGAVGSARLLQARV